MPNSICISRCPLPVGIARGRRLADSQPSWWTEQLLYIPTVPTVPAVHTGRVDTNRTRRVNIAANAIGIADRPINRSTDRDDRATKKKLPGVISVGKNHRIPTNLLPESGQRNGQGATVIAGSFPPASAPSADYLPCNARQARQGHPPHQNPSSQTHSRSEIRHSTRPKLHLVIGSAPQKLERSTALQ